MTNNNNTKLDRKVDFLKCLHVNMATSELSDLLVITACGLSESENAGIPKLIFAKIPGNNLTDGILEFNFIIQNTGAGPKKKVEWDVSVVFRMDALPKGIKAIKINAAQNADIALLAN